MTLIVALKAKDGLLVASDSRGTIGDPRGLTAIRDTQNKIVKAGSHTVIATAGASEVAAKILDELQPIVDNKKLQYCDEIMQALYEHARLKYAEWFEKFSVDKRPVTMFTVVGISNHAGSYIPRIYMLQSQLDFAPMLHDDSSLSGIPQYAVYLLHRLYDKNMALAHVKLLAAYLITETASQDPKVGGPVRMATVTQADGVQMLGEKEVHEIVQTNDKTSRSLKNIFFPSSGG